MTLVEVNQAILALVDEEVDVGITVHSSLKPTRHCEKAANTAMSVLKLIERNFHYRDRHVFVNLYKQYIRPHLEFSSPAWCPWNRGDIEKLESVQKRAVKMVAGLSSQGYKERCSELGLKTLEERRKDQDMNQVFGIMTGKGNIDYREIFERADVREGARTRQSEGVLNLKQPISRTEIRRNSFASRVVSSWNGLPDSVKSCQNQCCRAGAGGAATFWWSRSPSF
jgi:hypothetical protein